MTLEGCAAALAGLPGMGPSRLRALLQDRPPDRCWADVLAGEDGEDLQRAASRVDVGAVAAAHAAAGVGIHLLDGSNYPTVLAEDPAAPAVLFSMGDIEAVRRPLVGIVGTRRSTHGGRETARQFGRDLAAAGVGVVSGLALGIDGAAHCGSLAARPDGRPPVAVVGCGLDVVYPKRHAQLWRAIADEGVILSEWPCGTRPEPWRFPARNRIIAALADVLVVVESHAVGGSMHTVEAADARGRTILAVPGPVRSPASAGTNRLLYEGNGPARDVDDVLAALGLARPMPAVRDRRAAPGGVEGAVLEVVGWEPTSLEQILVRTGLSPAAVALALSRLEHDSWVRGDGAWWERVGMGD
ncbi:MAG TPA: DNA-processing protein DprA [Acidimicrobiales bacterium]|nr:DNA-processing protein DprA [Acidimicrobiales bacterium]